MANQNSALDLQAILANLAQFAPSAQASNPAVDRDEAPPPVDVAPAAGTPVALADRSHTREARVEDPRLKPQSRATASPRPMIDPATITTWTDGLRCVTKIAAQNTQFAASIRKMMKDQRRYEMQWYEERQALKLKQANRAKSSAEAQSILQSLAPGGGSNAVAAANVVDTEAELANFDRKIYDAQLALEADMTADLKALGVPFFGTHPSVIIPDGGADAVGRNDERPKWSPLITSLELLELRRRMVGHLEDLYRD